MSEQFDEQGKSFETDDVEAHVKHLESDPAEDTEGHMHAMDKAGWAADKAGLEVQDDDVAGHLDAPEYTKHVELDEDDVEGHFAREIEVDDDVVGKQGLQVQPPRDADNQGNQF